MLSAAIRGPKSLLRLVSQRDGAQYPSQNNSGARSLQQGSEINIHLKRIQELVKGREDLHDAECLDDLGVLGA